MAKITDNQLANPSGLITVKVSLSAAEVKTLGTTPIDAISSPGVGKYISIFALQFVYTAFITGYDDNAITLEYPGAINISSSGTGLINGISSLVKEGSPSLNYQVPSNNKVVIGGTDSVITGDGTVQVYIVYRIVNL